MTPHSPPQRRHIRAWVFGLASALAILAAVLFIDAPAPSAQESAEERQRRYEALRRSPEFQDAMNALRNE